MNKILPIICCIVLEFCCYVNQIYATDSYHWPQENNPEITIRSNTNKYNYVKKVLERLSAHDNWKNSPRGGGHDTLQEHLFKKHGPQGFSDNDIEILSQAQNSYTNAEDLSQDMCTICKQAKEKIDQSREITVTRLPKKQNQNAGSLLFKIQLNAVSQQAYVRTKQRPQPWKPQALQIIIQDSEIANKNPSTVYL